jgi:hypothetical protein
MRRLSDNLPRIGHTADGHCQPDDNLSRRGAGSAGVSCFTRQEISTRPEWLTGSA